MEEEIRDLIAQNKWNEVYEGIRRESMSHDYSRMEASKPENKYLNRYRDVYPYDHSRVKLENHCDTDYINASLVKVPRAKRKYILAQGPLQSTVGHFWLMAWQQDSRAVLMLNRVMERGQLKCHQYWPKDKGDVMEFPGVGLELHHVKSSPGDHYTVRNFRLIHAESGQSRDILHFHYTTWPDFGVPQCADSFLEFLEAVRASGSLEENVGPPIVHCSAGIGRSGTFCLVDSCLVLMKSEGPSAFRIKDILMDLRQYRMGLIQTPDQLKFSYLAIASGAVESGLIPAEILEGVSHASNDISSDESDDSDGCPPPLPPPRSESLRQQHQLQLAPLLQGSNGNLENSVSSTLEKTLNGGREKSSTSSVNAEAKPVLAGSSKDGEPSSASGGGCKTILNNQKMEERKRAMELRRRKKDEDRRRTEEKLQEIKRKSREADERKVWRSRMFETVIPFCFGLAMCAIGSYFYFRS